MKCRVCNYEVPDGKAYCPVCNTKVETKAVRIEEPAIDMSWNTVDFPKPKKLEDIDMNWGNYNAYMNKDASEGFVSIKKEEPKKPVEDFVAFKPNPHPAPQPAYQAPQPVREEAPASIPAPAPAQAPKPEPVFNAWTLPPQQQVPDTPLWYTQNFTASGVMKTGPAYPISQNPVHTIQPAPQPVYQQPQPAYQAPQPVYQQPQPAYQTPQPAREEVPAPKPEIKTPARIAEPVYKGLNSNQAAVAFQSVIPDATIQYMRVDTPKPVYEYTKPAYPKTEYAKPEYTKPAAIKAHEDIPETAKPAEKAPERFNTFIQKNDEFQKLLDREYERIHAIHGEDYDPIPQERKFDTLSSDEPIKAQGLSAFERTLYGETAKREEKKPEPAPVLIADEEETELSLEELIADPLNPKFDIHTLEHTINELKKAEAKDQAKMSERRAKLAAMEAAREAYFRSLDEELNIPPKTVPAVKVQDAASIKGETPEVKPQEQIPETKPEEETPVPATVDELISVLPQEESSEAEENEEKGEEGENVADASVIEGMDDEENTRDIEELTTELKGLYPDEEPAEEKKKSHFFLKFIIALVVIVLVLYLAQFLLGKFLPGTVAATTAADIWEGLSAAVLNLVDKAKTAISK